MRVARCATYISCYTDLWQNLMNLNEKQVWDKNYENLPVSPGSVVEKSSVADESDSMFIDIGQKYSAQNQRIICMYWSATGIYPLELFIHSSHYIKMIKTLYRNVDTCTLKFSMYTSMIKMLSVGKVWNWPYNYRALFM